MPVFHFVRTPLTQSGTSSATQESGQRAAAHSPGRQPGLSGASPARRFTVTQESGQRAETAQRAGRQPGLSGASPARRFTVTRESGQRAETAQRAGRQPGLGGASPARRFTATRESGQRAETAQRAGRQPGLGGASPARRFTVTQESGRTETAQRVGRQPGLSGASPARHFTASRESGQRAETAQRAGRQPGLSGASPARHFTAAQESGQRAETARRAGRQPGLGGVSPARHFTVTQESGQKAETARRAGRQPGLGGVSLARHFTATQESGQRAETAQRAGRQPGLGGASPARRFTVTQESGQRAAAQRSGRQPRLGDVSPARRFTAARESIPPRPLFPEHEPSRGRSAGSIRRRRRATGIAGAVTAQIDRWTENALSRDKTDDIQSRSRALAGKYLARGFRYARSAGGSAVRGTARHISLGVRLIRATRRGELSAAQAGGVYLRQGGRSLRGVAASAGRALRREAGSAILGFRGGQDLGLQALTRSRDLVLQARQFYRLSRGLLRFLTSPPVLKVMALAALTVIVFSFILGGVSSIASVIPVISLKSPEHELTETWKWITELDTDLKAEILNVERFNPGIDEFHYYLNGRSTALSRMDVETDAETLLAYLDSKYDDYTLATAVISPGGGAVRSVRAEIQRLHGLLYSLAIDEWQEIIIESDTDPDDGVDDSSETIIYHLDVRLTAKPFAEYLAANTALLLNEAEEEKLGALTQAGLFTTYQELGSPFPAGWVVSDRFGYRVHPIYRDKRLHTGLDIAKSEGEPIYACHSGTVSAGGNRTTGYGLWVRISKPNGDNTFYAHLSAQAVPDGTEARKGDLIGYVGNTGVSTGPHLHLEYTKKRQLLNPLFYTPGRVTTFAFIGNLYTRKFHRPTCWTLPNPENRSYFSRREDAVTAGYAPCLHCRP